MGKRRSSNYFKAITAMAVATLSVVVVAPNAPEASSFSDVKSTHQFYDAIKSLSDRGIIKGYQDGTLIRAKSDSWTSGENYRGRPATGY